MSNACDEVQERIMTPIDHIRLRPSMYIGRTSDGGKDDDGIYVLMKEVVDNAVHESAIGVGKRIEVDIDWKSGKCAVRDYGRGIPLDGVEKYILGRFCTVGMWCSDAPFEDVKPSLGLKVVNPLSAEFVVRSVRDGLFTETIFRKGMLVSTKHGRTTDPNERQGTYVRFIPDATIFKNFSFREKHVMRYLKMYADQNAGLSIVLNGKEIVSAIRGN